MKVLGWIMLPAITLALTLGAAWAQDAGKNPEKKGDARSEDKPAAGKDSEKPKDAGEAEPEFATVGKKAPAFTLKNADGKEVKLSDYAGKIVVLEWINLDCPWCKAHYDDKDELVKQQKKLREDGGEWLVICSSGKGKQGHFEGETLAGRIKKAGLENSKYLIDTDGAVGKKYKAATTPHAYVIDKEGVLRYAGALDNLPAQRRSKADPVNYVADAVKALLDGKEVATTEVKPYG